MTAVHDAEAILRARPVTDAPGALSAGTGAWVKCFADRREPLVRLVHHLDVRMSVSGPGREARAEHSAPQSRSIRLPMVLSLGVPDDLLMWPAFLATQLDAAVPGLGIAPRSGDWVDLGESTPSDCLALRTNTVGVPPGSDSLDRMDGSFLLKLASLFEEVPRRGLPAHSVLDGEPVEVNRVVSERRLAPQRSSARPGTLQRFPGRLQQRRFPARLAPRGNQLGSSVGARPDRGSSELNIRKAGCPFQGCFGKPLERARGGRVWADEGYLSGGRAGPGSPALRRLCAPTPISAPVGFRLLV